MAHTMAARHLADASTPAVLMVSGGSDSTALAYAAFELARAGMLGPLRIFHLNHLLRGEDADEDAAFVARLAGALGIEADVRESDVGAIAEREGANVEAVARRERYEAAFSSLGQLCRACACPISSGRVLTAHTADDRVESFYMRSIVGTGPGGFRSMRYANGRVVRPLLDATRERLRSFLEDRAASGAPVVRDAAGALWREDATNAHTDRFRAYVRHEIVPLAKRRNPRLAETLGRTMNLIADEDDMLEGMAADVESAHVTWEPPAGADGGCSAEMLGSFETEARPASRIGWSARIAPAFGASPAPLCRRVATRLLKRMLPAEARVEAASIEAVVTAFEGGAPKSGYVANIQGNIAVSANKRGALVEPMAAFRARRKKGKTL